MSSVIQGKYYHTKYRNMETGVAEFFIIPDSPMQEAPEGKLLCIGKIKHYAKGMPIEIQGDFKEDKFYVTSNSFISNSQKGAMDILEYIAKDLLESKKEKIVKASNNDLFSFCKDDANKQIVYNILNPSNKEKDKEIAIKQVDYIFRRIRALSEIDYLENTLMKYAIPFDKIMRMIRKGVTIQEIKSNPYIIFSKYDIDIRIADVFAREECNIELYQAQRIKGLVYSAIKYLLSCGNTCCTVKQVERVIRSRYKDILDDCGIGRSLINSCIISMVSACQYFEFDGSNYIYINHVLEEENISINNLSRLNKTKRVFNCTIGIDETEKELGICYNAGQKQAFELLKTSGVKILTGPPGSGKTAVLNGLIHNFEANENGTVKLAATTGMAAKVMHNATNRDTETANLMLRVYPFNDTVKGRDLNDPVDADFIIVDEISMMGLQLFSVLMQAARNGTIVLLVGDENQLQSVDYGNVLHELISSGMIEVCRLTEILRQSGSIVTNAIRVNEGDNNLIIDSTFEVNPCDESGIFQQLIRDFDLSDSQIICPIKNGPISTYTINRFIQEQYNSVNPIVAIYGKHTFRLQDKVIMTKTNYDKGYINGDMGYIVNKLATGELIVAFENRVIPIGNDDLCYMDLAYAITIHKSQGSEFKHIQIVLPQSAAHMMTRRLLYTAITRAKTKVTIYAEGESLNNAIKDEAERRRFSIFEKRLQFSELSSKNQPS